MTLRNLCLLTACTALAACGGGSDQPDPPVNQPPELSDITDQIIGANKVDQAVGLSVNDEAPGGVTLTVQSDQQTLLPDANQAVSGSGVNRTLLLTPSADETGQATITVTATDTAGLSDSKSFLLSVTPEQRSMQQFARAGFSDDPDDDPALINAVEFMQDADDDDFADLLAE